MEELLAQLTPNGVLLYPTRTNLLVRYVGKTGVFQREVIAAEVRYVPLQGEHGWAEECGLI